MAGVAPSRGGSRATTIGMIVSIIVAALLGGVLIYFTMQQEQLRSAAETATAAKAKLVKGNEENLARQMAPDSGTAGKTMVGELIRNLQMMSGRLTGNQNDPPVQALTKFDSALKKITSDKKVPTEKVSSALGAATVVENLYQFYSSELEARQKAEADRDKAIAEQKAAAASNEELKKNFGDQLAKINSKVEELQNAKSEFERLKSADIEALGSRVRASREDLDNLRKENSATKARLAKELKATEDLIDEQKSALASLRGPGAEGSQQLAVARDPVGKVMRALPGSALVGIDLGRRDHVVLGLTFTVYSGVERVPSDGRGKALVEVVSVHDKTSECRVISAPSPDEPILEGDRVGNIVLSRDRAKKQRFVVVGDFDVDFDGQIDANGTEKVKALVRRFGGVVVDRVDAMTDYVVEGIEPGEPEPVAVASAAEDEPAEATDSSADSDEKSADSDEAEDGEKSADAEEGSESSEDSKDAAADEDSGDEEKADDDAEATEDENKDDEKAAEDEGDKDEENADEKKPDPTPADKKPDVEKKSDPAPVKPEPVAPTIAKSPEIDITAGPRLRQQLTERQKYEDALKRADKFAIPKLTIDRFYNFIGLERGPVAKRQLEQ